MKYVKTKYGVFEKNKLGLELEIIKESYKLEKLFDEQIVEYNKNGKTIRREFVNHIYDGKIPEGEPEYYGAIRTEMGLRYIAKKIEGKWRLI